MKTDLHSHVLAGIDDGAEDLQNTAKVLKTLSAQGITHLALTPHYYPHLKDLDSFLKRREQAYQALLTLPEAQAFTFSLGAEVYFTDLLFNYGDLTPLCYKGTSFMLVELQDFERFSKATERNLYRLMEDYGITPVFAHIDRYPFLVKDLKLLSDLKGLGCLFQVNLQSFAPFLSRRYLYRLIDNGLVHFFGQDVHKIPLPTKQRNAILARIAKKDDNLMANIDRMAKKYIFVS
ncbi:MAG: hypothetical protein IKD18_03115 [Clostridia bacterium]|nr:hypothetical protein [Clostridia bacterium]